MAKAAADGQLVNIPARLSGDTDEVTKRSRRNVLMVWHP